MVTNATLTTEWVETGEKRDRIGRKITPGRRRAELVAAWRGSGLTQAEFARREGIIYSSFAHWVQQTTKQAPAVCSPRVKFAEVARPAALAPALEIRLPDGMLLRGGNVADLAKLVRALRN